MKIIRNISRIPVGVVFVFSGFVKGIDPWGSAYKFIDYFSAFGMEWLNFTALPFAFLLPALELLIGIALLFNLFIRRFAFPALLFMGFFLMLTLYIALANPVSDCGCFGDALILSNWDTFYKNIVLTILALVVFAHRKSFHPFFRKNIQAIAMGSLFIVYLGISFYAYAHLPVIDFRPYKVGVNITEAMQIPEGAAHPVYENTFHYKNKTTGKVEQFNDDNHPWQDTLRWEFVKMDEPELIAPGYTPPIHGFTIETPDGEDVKAYFLDDDNYTFFVIAYDLRKTNIEKAKRLNKLYNEATAKGYHFICLTASVDEEIATFRQQTGAAYDFLFTDEVTLKTIIRSNPGVMLTRKGTILDKWHYNDIPELSKIEAIK